MPGDPIALGGALGVHGPYEDALIAWAEASKAGLEVLGKIIEKVPPETAAKFAELEYQRQKNAYDSWMQIQEWIKGLGGN